MHGDLAEVKRPSVQTPTPMSLEFHEPFHCFALGGNPASSLPPVL